MAPNCLDPVDPDLDGRIELNGRILPGTTYGTYATNDDAATLWVISRYVPAAHDGARWAS